MLTCIEQYYVDKLCLNVRLNANYELAVLGMGEIGMEVCKTLAKTHSQPVIWQIDGKFPLEHSDSQSPQKNSHWLASTTSKLSVVVTPIRGHDGLMENLRDKFEHQFLGYQIADFSEGKRWLQERLENPFTLLRRYPDERYIWQKYLDICVTENSIEVHRIQEIMSTILDIGKS